MCLYVCNFMCLYVCLYVFISLTFMNICSFFSSCCRFFYFQGRTSSVHHVPKTCGLQISETFLLLYYCSGLFSWAWLHLHNCPDGGKFLHCFSKSLLLLWTYAGCNQYSGDFTTTWPFLVAHLNHLFIFPSVIIVRNK